MDGREPLTLCGVRRTSRRAPPRRSPRLRGGSGQAPGVAPDVANPDMKYEVRIPMTLDDLTEVPVLQMRLVVAVDNYEEAVAFYRDVLGASQSLQGHSPEGACVTILEVGRATLEIANASQVDLIDEVEVGRPVSPHLRVAFEVFDTSATTDRLVRGGATLVAPPTTTPWASLNSRLEAPGDLQLTIFQELGDSPTIHVPTATR